MVPFGSLISLVFHLKLHVSQSQSLGSGGALDLAFRRAMHEFSISVYILLRRLVVLIVALKRHSEHLMFTLDVSSHGMMFVGPQVSWVIVKALYAGLLEASNRLSKTLCISWCDLHLKAVCSIGA